MRSIWTLAVTAFLAFGTVGTSRASDVTFTFTSIVSENEGTSIPVGSLYQFSYTIDTSEVPTTSGSGLAQYYILSASLTVDGQTVTAANGSLLIFNNMMLGQGQEYQVAFFAEAPGSFSSTLFGNVIANTELNFQGTANMLTGLGIPTTTAFAQFATNYGASLVFGSGDTYIGAFNEPYTFTASAVPEPSSLIIASTAAFAGLGLWSRRRGR
jgi:hypothetical protein